MSKPSERKYLPHLKSVSLIATVTAPDTGSSADGFGHERYRFFIEAGFFCIEAKKNGRVVDVPPSQIRGRVWFTQSELDLQATAERIKLEATRPAPALAATEDAPNNPG